MLLVIDNYDSFTFNLVQAFETLGKEVAVFRNDRIDVRRAEELAPDGIVISPGPCTPEKAGISVELVRRMSGRVPILGVCLGHQAVAAAFGARVVRAGRVMHGKTSRILHDGRGIFRGLPCPFVAGRYHSLIVDEADLPACLEVSARSEEGEIMAIRHKSFATEGVQFHPESVLTPEGMVMLKNFLEYCSGSKPGRGLEKKGGIVP